MKTAHNIQTALPCDLAAAPVPTGQLMESSETPEQKIAAFMTLFYIGTDETITQAVDSFYENPSLFSKTVQDLSSSKAHKSQLKSFLQKLADPELRIHPFIKGCYESCLRTRSMGDYKEALMPFFALKDTFEGVDRNRRASHSCPSACDLLSTFNTVNRRLNLEYVPSMFKKISTLERHI